MRLALFPTSHYRRKIVDIAFAIAAIATVA